ncbi:Ig-like domain-containing protein [Roseobacter sinensis]|uniref:Ig-like domain-containing protein n=1 Tax=Roseobacter sinensis TaxID=2931391 RepID=A0ABT3BJR0_9RHOB|nr:Ig-like domain-containing protein [Roseobacter sp. WL0113]MCV3273813.1 Ig-like domain-containing protein [Roseobacter sp. WL0113]
MSDQTQNSISNTIEAVQLDGTLKTTVTGGRVTTLDLPDQNIVGVRVLENADFGNVTVNPDNSLALVLTGINNSETEALDFEVEVAYANGGTSVKTVNVTVEPPLQDSGWGTGDFYMLETDAQGDLVIEHGDNHRKVYISGDESALTLAEIAQENGLDVSKITGEWLADNPEYGSTPGKALAADAGMALWYSINGLREDANSNWLLFERGYDYGDVGRLIPRGARGESELHPQVITAYGTGDRPVIQSEANMFQSRNENIVIQDLDFQEGVKAFWGENVIFDNVSVTGGIFSVRSMDGFTLRNSEVIDVVRDEPINSADGTWEQVSNRISGLYVTLSDGVLVDNNLLDHNGWEEGYDYNVSTDAGQPPSFYSHNVYIQSANDDVTFSNNINMRGASFGAQIRSGGFIEDNIFLDNNAALSTFGGNFDNQGYTANYSLIADNLVVSAGHKRVAEKEGALSLGIGAYGQTPTLVDNIITHLADPNNPAEQAEKTDTNSPLKTSVNAEAPVFDDTIIYNWLGDIARKKNGPNNTNVEGLDPAVLDQTTIQKFAAQVLNKPNATISDLADYLRANADGSGSNAVDADMILAYFQKSFGIAQEARTDDEVVRFVPNAIGDGVRWDNRLNWSTEDLPGSVAGDSVALAGNWVNYAGTTTLKGLDLGQGGRLAISQGHLEVTGGITADMTGRITIDRAGQLWAASYRDSDLLDLDIDGGRFANTGVFEGRADIDISDNAQAILATDGARFVLGSTSSLSIEGSDAKVGFDGDSTQQASLSFASGSELRFVADADGLGSITEFRSGHFSAGTDVRSAVDIDGAQLELDLSQLTATLSGATTLIEADELTGRFASVNVTGLANGKDAFLTYNYAADEITLRLGVSQGDGGKLFISEIQEDNGPVNTAPEAVNDAYSTAFDTKLVVGAQQGVLSNDSDVDGDTLLGQVLTGPRHGTLTLSAEGGFEYTPERAFSGTDTFTYEVSDGSGGVDTATVEITVEDPVDQGPSLVLGTDGNDYLTGTDADEVLRSFGGRSDVLAGGAGADVFDFSSSVGNGVRETRTIRDFEVGIDSIDLGDHEVASFRVMGQSLYITLDPELDMLILNGVTTLDDSYFI